MEVLSGMKLHGAPAMLLWQGHMVTVRRYKINGNEMTQIMKQTYLYFRKYFIGNFERWDVKDEIRSDFSKCIVWF